MFEFIGREEIFQIFVFCREIGSGSKPFHSIIGSTQRFDRFEKSEEVGGGEEYLIFTSYVEFGVF